MERASWALDDLRQEMPGCVALGIADLAAGILRHPREPSEETLPLTEAAAVARDLLQGGQALGWGAVIGEARQANEAVVLARNSIHLFAQLPSDPGSVLIAICEPSRNLGLLLSTLRRGAEALAW